MHGLKGRIHSKKVNKSLVIRLHTIFSCQPGTKLSTYVLLTQLKKRKCDRGFDGCERRGWKDMHASQYSTVQYSTEKTGNLLLSLRAFALKKCNAPCSFVPVHENNWQLRKINMWLFSVLFGGSCVFHLFYLFAARFHVSLEDGGGLQESTCMHVRAVNFRSTLISCCMPPGNLCSKVCMISWSKSPKQTLGLN